MTVRSTLFAVADEEETAPVEGLPGRRLGSGFDYRPVADFPELELPDGERDQVLEKMNSVDKARLRAAESSSRTYVG
jgi:hypothetical protein